MPSSFCFYLYTENLSLPVFVPILAYKKDTCQNMPVSLLHFFRITHPYNITVIEISSVFTSFPYMIWCWGQKVFCPQLMPTTCSAAKQLPQFYKHSKSADLLRKSLLSHVWRVPSSKALSCKHERLFDLLTLASSYNETFYFEWVASQVAGCIFFEKHP